MTSVKKSILVPLSSSQVALGAASRVGDEDAGVEGVETSLVTLNAIAGAGAGAVHEPNPPAVGNNTFFGVNAGAISITGLANVFIGANSGSNDTGSIANIAIGNASGGADADNGGTLSGTLNNVYIGDQSGVRSNTGIQNTAVGAQTLSPVIPFNQTGNNNTCLGFRAGRGITAGDNNICIGLTSASTLTTGSNNTVIGNVASGLTTGSNNMVLGRGVLSATPNDVNKIVLADGVNAVTAPAVATPACSIGNVRGVTTAVADAIAVLIDSTGQLGTVSSSQRFKENIRDLEHSAEAVLSLEPKSFDWKEEIGGHKDDFGLIAEEVQDVLPSLVVHNQEGEVESVAYHKLPTLLLHALKKQQAQLDELLAWKEKCKCCSKGEE